MIDDSLSDTQQGNKMSAEQISFECECGKKLVIKFENEELKFLEQEEFLALSRGEAHLLMLYLQEHLNAK
jgi:hypothetical protein